MAVELMSTLIESPVHSSGENETTVAAPVELLRSVFKSISSSSCPHHANFHMHTVFSDGNLTPGDLVRQAIQIGLSDFAITDHHSVGGYRQARALLDEDLTNGVGHQHSRLPRLWVGTEVNAQLLDTEVHILCYAFDVDAIVMQPYLQGETVIGDRYLASSVIASVHEAGGLTVLAHPDRYRQSPAELIPEAARLGIDGVETYYAYDNPSPWRPSPKQTERVRQLVEDYQLFHTCGTDTHGLNLLTRL